MNITRISKAGHGSYAIPVVVAGALSSVLLAFSMTPTFSALAASIQNTVNTAGTGTLTMQEANSGGDILCNSTDGGSVSTNSATCATINTYGANLNMVPNQTVTTTISIKDTGSVPTASFTLAGGPCVQSNNGTVNGTALDLCAKIKLLVKSGATTIYTGTATGFAAANLNISTLTTTPSLAAGASVPFSFAVTLDGVGNAYQGLKATQGMTFAFGA